MLVPIKQSTIDYESIKNLEPSCGTPLLDLLIAELKSLLRGENNFSKILLPFFYINPDKIEFNGKLFLLTRHTLQQSKDHIALVHDFISLIYFSKKINWAQRFMQILVKNQGHILDQDQIHRLTSIFSGQFILG